MLHPALPVPGWRFGGIHHFATGLPYVRKLYNEPYISRDEARREALPIFIFCGMPTSC